LRAGYAAGSPEPRELMAGFVEGYNRYLKDAGGKLPAACVGAGWVRPMTLDDMMLVIAEKALHASGQVFSKDFVAADRAPGAATLAKAAARRIDPGTLVAQLDALDRQVDAGRHAGAGLLEPGVCGRTGAARIAAGL